MAPLFSAAQSVAQAAIPSLRYRRPAVRDLAWLIFDGALRLPVESGLLATVRLDENEKTELLSLLAGWDKDPSDGWLGAIDPRLRLGLYTERLIGAWLQHSRLIRLVAKNWPLRVNRITVGEADFLVERLGGGRPRLQLWELACKFYLGVPGRGWLGPGLNDSLAAKLYRVRSHQLQLIHHAGFQAAWGADWGARAWIAGWLLEPAACLLRQPVSSSAGLPDLPSAPEGAPPSSSPPRIASVWAEVGDESADIAERHAQALGVGEWWLLPKRRWLRPVFSDEPVAQRFAGLDDAASFLAQSGAHSAPGGVPERPTREQVRPLMLAGVRWPSSGSRPATAPVAAEVMRLMLVPPGWTLRARDQPVRA